MGSRYGGLKQLDPVGPDGETILDYSVFDALQAGFDRVVFVIRRDFEAEFRARIGARYVNRLCVDYAFQRIDDLPSPFTPPSERVKPWGTGHAVWCAREVLGDSPFALLNADDFYGRDALHTLARFLTLPTEATPPAGALAGYRLSDTLSAHGSVARGVCAIGPGGELESIVEHTAISRNEAGAIISADHGPLSERTIVSLNCWALPAGTAARFEPLFIHFLQANRDRPGAEFYLPAAIADLIGAGELSVHCLPVRSRWFGITYRSDHPAAVAAVRELVARGDYPAPLWSPSA